MDPSTGHELASSWVSVLLNIAGVDASLYIKSKYIKLSVELTKNMSRRKNTQ